MTVREFINQHKHDKYTLWLCPNIVNNHSINQQPLEQGLEFQNYGSVPSELLDKEVTKCWRENGCNCIIWKNR